MSAAPAHAPARPMALALLLAPVLALAGCTAPPREARADPVPEAAHVAAASPVAAGEYLTVVGGCNDCHTPTWNETFGQTPADERLVGLPVGFRGPWGTSYPANLRLSVQGKSAAEWIAMVRNRKGMPPMPWMNLHRMSDRDLGAVHAYLVSLGPKGRPAPAYVPPGQEPATPYIVFEPVMPRARN